MVAIILPLQFMYVNRVELNKTIQDLHSPCIGKRECYNFAVYATDREIKIQNNRNSEKNVNILML